MKQKEGELMDIIGIALPKDVGGTMELPSKFSVLDWKEYNNRRLVINEEVTDDYLSYSQLIIEWNKVDKNIPVEERVPIKILLHTYGGSLDACWSFINVIKLSKTPIHIVNMGICASAGFLIFLAGTKRYAMPGSNFLLHEGQIRMEGQTTKVLENLDDVKKTEKTIETFVLENTKIDKKNYTKNRKKEWWMKAEEALELGVADEIVQDIDILYN